MVVPVPFGACQVNRFGGVGRRIDTNAVDEIVAFVTSQAATVGVVRSTLVRNGNTTSVGVEDVSFGTDQTYLIVPVPCAAAEVVRFGSV